MVVYEIHLNSDRFSRLLFLISCENIFKNSMAGLDIVFSYKSLMNYTTKKKRNFSDLSANVKQGNDIFWECQIFYEIRDLSNTLPTPEKNYIFNLTLFV